MGSPSPVPFTPLVARHPIEPLEDPETVLVRDAETVVPHREDCDRSVEPAGQFHRPVGRTELQRIPDQVLEDLLHAAAVAPGREQPRGEVGHQAHRALDRDRLEVIEHALGDLSH